MFEILYRRKADVVRHRTAPFAEGRERYLRHCAEQGGTWGRLRTNAKWMRWAAVRMSPNDCRGVNAARLHDPSEAQG